MKSLVLVDLVSTPLPSVSGKLSDDLHFSSAGEVTALLIKMCKVQSKLDGKAARDFVGKANRA